MLNKDNEYVNFADEYNNIDESKYNASIFNFSLLKSKQIIVSNSNNFNLDFSKEKPILKYIINIGKSSNINDNQLISEKKTNHINNCYLNSHEDEMLSSYKRWNKNLTMNDFESSFANYCGINKEEIKIINNQSKLHLTDFININLPKKIVDLLNLDSPPLIGKKKYLDNKRYKTTFITHKINHSKTNKTKKDKKIKNIILNDNDKDNDKNILDNNDKRNISTNDIFNHKTSSTIKNKNKAYIDETIIHNCSFSDIYNNSFDIDNNSVNSNKVSLFNINILGNYNPSN